MIHAVLMLALASHPCVEVTGPRITAGDIPAFSALPPSTDFGFAPAFGSRRVLRAGETEVCVVRRGRTLDKEDVIAAIRKSLPEGSEFELADFDSDPVPAGDLEFPISGLHGQRWRGYVRTAEHTSVPVQATVRVATRRTRAFAARNIAVGDTIAADAIELREQRLPGIPNGLPPIDVIGKTATQTIAAGTPIELRMVRPKPAVTAGEIVSVTVIGGPATLRFEARAQSQARIGDTLLVRSPLNGSLVRAKVSGDHSAIVEAAR